MSLFTFLAFFGTAICLMGVVWAKCDSTLSVILFTVAMGLNGLTFSGFLITHVDMAPDYAGTLMGITNSIANFPGFLAPLVVSAFTSNDVRTRYIFVHILI